MIENNGIKERLYSYLDYKELTPYKFERRIDVGNNYLKNVKTLGGEVLAKIANAYDDLDMEWLLTGKGEMIKGETAQSTETDDNAEDNIVPTEEETERSSNYISAVDRIDNRLSSMNTYIVALVDVLRTEQEKTKGIEIALKRIQAKLNIEE